ncbi:N-acetylgalactosamine kinase, partial [Kappamyces sp. JEL0680]
RLGLAVQYNLPTLKQVHESVVGVGADLSQSFSLMLGHVERELHAEPYSLEEVARELGMTADTVQAKYIAGIKIEAAGFKLHARAKHVFAEAQRVYAFRDIAVGQSSDFLKEAGALMNASHESCRDVFGCSCPELDELTSLCRQAAVTLLTVSRAQGAFGSRLTGAGWGGCTVSLIAADRAPEFIDQIREKYYFKHWPEWRNDKAALERLDGFLFASPACIGALTITL